MHLRLWNFSSAIQSRGNFRGQSRAGPESACPEDLLAQNICLPRGTHPGPGCSEAPSSHLHPWCPTAAACTPRIIERSRCVEKLNKSTSPRRGWTNAYADCICLPRGEYAAPGCPAPPLLSLSLSLSLSPPPPPPLHSLSLLLSLSLSLSPSFSPSRPLAPCSPRKIRVGWIAGSRSGLFHVDALSCEHLARTRTRRIESM
jgi:hypothetical protein